MPTIVLAGGDATSGGFGGMWNAGFLLALISDVNTTVSGSPTQVTYTNTLTFGGTTTLVATGSFSNFDALGDPQAGTVTGFTYTTYFAAGVPVTMTVSGISIAVPSLYNWVLTDNVAALETALFGGDDTFTGTAFADHINAFGGTDTVNAGNGNDNVFGVGGNDTLNGEDGNDYMDGGVGNDVLNGGGGNDELVGGDGADQLFGEGGNDRFHSDAGDLVDGGDGADQVFYNAASSNITLRPDIWNTATGQSLLNGGNIRNVEFFTIGGDVVTIAPTFATAPGYSPQNTVDFTTTLTLDFSGSSLAIGMSQNGSSQNNVLLGGPFGDLWLQIHAVGFPTSAYHVTGSVFGDTLLGGTGNDAVNGGDGNDSLRGFGGNDALLGGNGADTIFADLFGNDVIDGGAETDLLHFGGTGAVTVNLNIIIQQDTGAGLMTITGVEDVVGSSQGDIIIGDAGANALHGGDGDDTLSGGAGNDTLNGGDGADTITGSGGADTIDGGASGDTINLALADGVDTFVDGGTGTDTIIATGSIGDETLSVAWAGASFTSFNSGVVASIEQATLDMGGGVDTLRFENSSVGVSINLAAGAATGFTAISGVENASGSSLNDNLNGDDGANALLGGGGDDTLIGGAGADVLDGGAGIDAISYAGSAAAVTVDLAANSASGGDAAGDTLSGIESVIGSAFADTLVGNAAANALIGDVGNDTLTGDAGADSISGGDDDDIINYNFGDGVDASIDGGTGTDRIVTFGNAGGETLDVRWTGTGFTFWKGSNVVSVEQGVADMGGGVDWLRNHNSNVGVSVNLALGTATGFISIANIENAWGSAFADTLTGSAVANIIRGGAGDDQIDGGADNDTLVGDDGIDTILGGAGADTIYGLSGGDIINAGDDNDTIYYSFGEGVDSIDGGLGTDAIICQGNSGAETLEVIWNGASFTFFKGGAVASIEQASVDMGLGGDWLRYTGSSASISINLSANTASGFTAIANIENAGGGSGSDAITGSNAANNLIGNDGADQIDGAGGNDTLNGGAGADRLTGGADSDALTGGADADTFVFATGSGADSINDFDADATGGQDFIDLSGYGITALDFAARVTIADQGANTLITIDGVNTIILHGVTGDGANVVTQGDFILGP